VAVGGARALRDALHGSAGPKRRLNMPEVVVYALGGRSLDQKRGLMKDITDAVVKNYKVEPAAVVITLVESEKQDKMKGGVLFSEAGQHK
jgi:4-oxalocrotonate tautomerase